MCKTNSAPGVIFGTVDARAFTARLKTLKKCADTQGYHTIPILNCCTIEFDPLIETVRLSHYGLDAAVSTLIAADGSGDGAVCVPMKTLLAFLSAADGDMLTMTKREDDSVVTFTCGRYAIGLVPLPVYDVPRLKTPDVFARGFALGEGVLAHLFALTVPFVSTEETRYCLNGVCFEIEADKVRAIATDGHKLGTREAKTPAPLEAWDYHPIVPRLSVAAIATAIGKDQCTIRFHAEKVQGKEKPDLATGKTYRAPDYWQHQVAEFSSDKWTVTTKLIDGNFPDWRRVIPKVESAIATIKLHAGDLKRVGAMGKAVTQRGVKLAPNMEGVTASIQDADHFSTSQFRADIRAEVIGEFEAFGVNHQYLKNIAAALGAEWIEMAFESSAAPFLMRGKDAPEGDFAVLMSMRVY